LSVVVRVWVGDADEELLGERHRSFGRRDEDRDRQPESPNTTAKFGDDHSYLTFKVVIGQKEYLSLI
jgi:hypothetical protein